MQTCRKSTVRGKNPGERPDAALLTTVTSTEVAPIVAVQDPSAIRASFLNENFIGGLEQQITLGMVFVVKKLMAFNSCLFKSFA